MKRSAIFLTSFVLFLLFLCTSSIFAKDVKISATATASTVYNNDPAYGADKAVDGDPSTVWIGDKTDAAGWIKFDLGGLKNVKYLTTRWYNDYFYSNFFQIQISDDGQQWETVSDWFSASSSGSSEDVYQINRQTRYVQFSFWNYAYNYIMLRDAIFYASVDVPRTFRFQGTLQDGQGAPVDVSHTVIFRMYEAASGGVPVWSETQANVLIDKGLLDVELGSVNPITLSLSTQHWLSVEIDSDGEMSPRFKLTSVPYAIRSGE